MKIILNCCMIRNCEETHVSGSKYCKAHKDARDRAAMILEIKKLRIRIAKINHRNEMIRAGMDPTPFRNVWIVEGLNWIYT